MRSLFFLMMALMLLPGCIGGEDAPDLPEQELPEQNQSGPPVVVIIDPQKNQSVAGEEKEDPGQEPAPEPREEAGYSYAPDEPLGIYFVDVSGGGEHGNAILVKKGDFDMLIDAGPAGRGPALVDYLRARGVDDLEVVVSTNADPRNYGALGAVADRFHIETLWWSGDDLNDPAYRALMGRLQGMADETLIVETGFSAEHNGVSFLVLNPQKSRSRDVNNDAIVIRIDDRDLSLLLTSGIQTGAQGELINRYSSQIQVDVMQAPYYGVGAGTSAIGLFLISAKPEHIIITGSEDESPEMGGDRSPFRRLMDQYGITYHENYKSGPIRVSSGPQGYGIDHLG